MSQPEILVVDDDALFRAFCRDALQTAGYAVATASSGGEALDLLRRASPVLVLTDIFMPGLTGLELLETIKAQTSSVDVIVMTGYASVETAVKALQRGAADYLRKPFAEEELTAVVQATLARRRICQENQELRGQLRLYEMSRPLIALEDPERVMELGLEALLQATETSSGLCLYAAAGVRSLDLKYHRGLSLDDANAVREALVAKAGKRLASMTAPQVLGASRLQRFFGRLPASGSGEALLVPLLRAGALEGAFVLLRTEGSRLSATALEAAQFLGQQIELGYEAAHRTQQARTLAFIDPLTDLYNARYLQTELERRIAEAERQQTPFSVLFLDLDFFKEVNDVYGHLTGGQVLIEVSRVLLANVRDDDVVIRYGGDEFTVVLPKTDSNGAREVAERIRTALREHVFLRREGRFIHLTACIGVATFPDDARTRDELIEQADRAMYRAKEAERDAVYLARTH